MKQIKIILIFIIIFLIYKNCFHKEKLVEGYPGTWRTNGRQPYRFNEAEARRCVDGIERYEDGPSGQLEVWPYLPPAIIEPEPEPEPVI